jgi:DNA-binding MarR family transcriptional regulator
VTRWLDPVEMRAWRAFIETVGDLLSALEADLAVVGLTLGDYQVLVHLSEQEDQSMRMCDLASLLQLSPSGLTRRLDGLVGRGLVVRQPSPDDRRVSLARLTEQGRAELTRAAPHHVASVRRHLVDRVGAADLGGLARSFEAVRAGLDPAGARDVVTSGSAT